jgi:hypothetical protein
MDKGFRVERGEYKKDGEFIDETWGKYRPYSCFKRG